jgi:bifunctional DNase/RNase
MIEMTIESIRVSLMNYQRVVILKEKGMERYLPIWIGPAEAEAIAVRLQEVAVARPLTHDLLRSVIDALGPRSATSS